MSRIATVRSKWPRRAYAALETLLYGLSAYGVPALIAVMSVIALFTFNRQYTIDVGKQLEIRVLEQSGDDLKPARALAELSTHGAVAYWDTHLSESPFWFIFATERLERNLPVDVELPSRH